MRKLLNILLMVAVISLSPAISEAKTLNDIFGEGVFETSWGMSVDEVKTKFPAGKLQKVMGAARYFVDDGRTLFGIERSKSDYIGFLFDARGKLTSVSIGMPSGTGAPGRVQNAITSAVGITPESAKNSNGFPVTRWDDDSGVIIDLMETSGLFSRSVILMIEKMPTPSKTSKESLGF